MTRGYALIEVDACEWSRVCFCLPDVTDAVSVADSERVNSEAGGGGGGGGGTFRSAMLYMRSDLTGLMYFELVRDTFDLPGCSIKGQC